MDRIHPTHSATPARVQPPVQGDSRDGTAPERLALRDSLRLRVPLVFGVLVLATLGAFLWTGYRELEQALVASGERRARAAAELLAGEIGRSLALGLEREQQVALGAAIVAALHAPGDATLTAATEALAGSSPSGLRRIELWDAAGRQVLAIHDTAADSLGGLKAFPADRAPAGPGVSPLLRAGEQTFFQVVVPVSDTQASGAPLLGYVRRYDRFQESSAGIVARLLGDSASVRLGSRENATWTDLTGLAGAPPAEVDALGPGEFRAADGRRWVGAEVAIAGTPWVTWVGYPRAAVLAPARAFLTGSAMLAALLLVGSGMLGVLFGVRLTSPLHALTKAANRIAARDYARRVRVRGRDEVAHLGTAFNTMAARIEEAHAALRETNHLTSFALTAAGIGVWEHDLASGRLKCTESMARVLGVPPHELPTTGEGYLELVHPEDRPHLRALLNRDTRGGVFDIECRVQRPGEGWRWIEGKGKVRHSDDGSPLSVLGVSMDVTEKRRMESQLRQSQKMEAVGQLAGGVAHDFNNLLTAIVGHGQMLLGDLPEKPELREDVIGILRAAESAAGLTRQLLTFSRREVVQPEVLLVNDAVLHTERLLRRLLGARIGIELSLSEHLPAVKIDAGHFEQVLINLAVNARDAMPGGGTLRFATSARRLRPDEVPEWEDPAADVEYVILTVSDTGAGMSESTRARIFEPFFTTKPSGKGTGLGLATVFGIVKQTAGHIVVESETGRGTTFTIYLPATNELPPVRETPTNRPTHGRQERILLVEDNPAVRRIAASSLERLGYRVVAAPTGEEALFELAMTGRRPDLVVTDVEMPGMTGPELVRELAIPYPGVPVVFTSGYIADELERFGIQAADVHFLPKPYSPADLAEKVAAALLEANARG